VESHSCPPDWRPTFPEDSRWRVFHLVDQKYNFLHIALKDCRECKFKWVKSDYFVCEMCLSDKKRPRFEWRGRLCKFCQDLLLDPQKRKDASLLPFSLGEFQIIL
jgi:hypothetical protein